MDIIELTKKLIEIPSFLDKGNDEKAIGNFIYDFLKNNCPYLVTLERQRVTGGRFNIIARSRGETRLLFACHLDTVSSSRGGKYNPLKAVSLKGRLYGLGAKDMKGGTAALLTAMANIKEASGLATLFYIDEEYKLRGMKKFVKTLDYKPDLVVSPESNFEITNGRRGILTLLLKIRGRSAHAARPYLGKNAVVAAYEVASLFEKTLARFHHPVLGKTTCCPVYVKGGSKNNLNLVPDTAEVVFNIRPTDAKVSSEVMIQLAKRLLESKGFHLVKVRTLHNYQPSFVEPKKLVLLEKAILSAGAKAVYDNNLGYHGFNDVSLIYEKVGADFVNFGPRGENSHQPDEWVSIESLEKTKKIYEFLIRSYCQ